MYIKLVYYILVSLVFIQMSFFVASGVWAQEYVLPYPSFMPGHPFYKVQNIVDKIQEFYSFGSFAKFKYHLEMADKNLVEAKVLFEYKQYLLASQVLPQYEDNLRKAGYYLGKAKNEGKNISGKEVIFKKAITKHKEVLMRLKQELPESFLWVPEKAQPRTIEIKRILERNLETGRKLETK